MDMEPGWTDFLSLTEFDDLTLLVPRRLSPQDVDLSSAICQDVSLRDAVVTGRARLLRMESTNSSHSDPPIGARVGLATTGGAFTIAPSNGTARLAGCLDEAVFEQINLLGLEGLDTMDAQLLEGLGPVCPPPPPAALDDSDSGLSLGTGPGSPGGTSSGSFDEGGATGYSSSTDSPAPWGGAHEPPLSTEAAAEHDHSYAARGIKEEPPSEEEERQLSRDEARARALLIPVSAPEIVSMPVEDFLELLEGRRLTAAQVALLRDIRRRGKNKLAAQSCRKRKLDAISGLQGEVEALRARRATLLRERAATAKGLGLAARRLDDLSRRLLSRLRDGRGRPLTPERYTLQCGADGRVAVREVGPSSSDKMDNRRKNKKP